MSMILEVNRSIWIAILLTLNITTTHAETAVSDDDAPYAWANLEYLSWRSQDSAISIPLTTQNNNHAAFGFINEPGTQIVIGKGSKRDEFDFGDMHGARLTLGAWLDESHQYGVEISGFDLSQVKKTFSATSINSPTPILNIPFFDTETGSENVLVGRLPNTATVSDTFHAHGYTLNGLYDLQNQVNYPWVFTLGLRYVNINEKLQLNDGIIGIEYPGVPANAVVNVQDNFATKNHFYGLQVGARTHAVYHDFSYDVTAAIALGNNYQKLSIDGQTNVDGRTVVQPIGLFAEPSNSGTHKHHQLTIVPELQAKINYHLYRNIQPFIAYNFLYISHVIRPGKQIDRHINLSQNSLIGGTGVLSGPAAPVAKFHNTSMWMQGVSAGVEIRF